MAIVEERLARMGGGETLGALVQQGRYHEKLFNRRRRNRLSRVTTFASATLFGALVVLGACFGAPNTSGSVCVPKTEQDLKRLAELGEVSCWVTIEETSLQSLDALIGLRTAPGMLIRQNDLLNDLDALSSVSSIEHFTLDETEAEELKLGDLHAEEIAVSGFDSPGIRKLSSNRTTLTKLDLYRNSRLTLLEFPTLQSIGTLRVKMNGQLADLSAFGALRNADFLEVAENPDLTHLALPAEFRAGTSIVITKNPQLEASEAQAFVQAQQELGFSGGVTVCGNKNDQPCAE
ncbi:MAG: hypothetical protein AB2A00_21610 [Myxococcota bacterium]